MDISRAQSVLLRSLEAGRLAHGLLLYGEDATQLEAVAAVLAGRLFSAPSGVDPLQHPDCFVLRPANKMRRISVGAIRDLIRSVQQTASQGEVKVVVIHDADRMATEAANAFLKTLEEPPAGTTVLLLTTRPNSILPTIRSRCLCFRIHSSVTTIADSAWQEWLRNYTEWLIQLQTAERNKEVIPTLLFSTYALAARLENLLAQLADSQWQKEKENLDELEDEEVDALEAGVRKSVRSSAFREIAVATHAFAIEHHTAANGLASRLLPRVIERLESIVGLFEANLNEATAIENFFLYSLKVWRMSAGH